MAVMPVNVLPAPTVCAISVPSPSWISAREASRLPFKSSRYFASHPEKTVQAPLSAKRLR